MNKILLRVAKGLFQQCMQGFAQQINVVREAAAAPMQAAVAEVMNGVWRGVGADAFVEEVTNIEIPLVGAIGDEIDNTMRNLQRAEEIMEEADQKATQAVRSIEETFRRIAAFS